MEYRTSKFSLTEAQYNLRIGLTNLIREYAESGMSREDVKKVLEHLDLVLDDHRFKERDVNEEFYDAVFNLNKDLLDEE